MTSKPLKKKNQKYEDQKGSNDHLDPEYEKLMHTDISKGLTTEEIEKRLERFGRNGISDN